MGATDVCYSELPKYIYSKDPLAKYLLIEKNSTEFTLGNAIVNYPDS